MDTCLQAMQATRRSPERAHSHVIHLRTITIWCIIHQKLGTSNCNRISTSLRLNMYLSNATLHVWRWRTASEASACERSEHPLSWGLSPNWALHFQFVYCRAGTLSTQFHRVSSTYDCHRVLSSSQRNSTDYHAVDCLRPWLSDIKRMPRLHDAMPSFNINTTRSSLQRGRGRQLR